VRERVRMFLCMCVHVCVRVCAWGGGIEARSKLVYVYMRVTVESKPEDSRK
jgi:hypothetical protein